MAMIPEIENGLLFLSRYHPFYDGHVFFNKGDAVKASFDFDSVEKFESNPEDEEYDIDAIAKAYLEDPVHIRKYYSSRHTDLTTQECSSCDRSKNEEMYVIRLDNVFHERCVDSRCIEILKEANCDESCFFRVCKNDPWRFYAKLTEEQAEDVRGVHGMYDVSKHDELSFWFIVE